MYARRQKYRTLQNIGNIYFVWKDLLILSLFESLERPRELLSICLPVSLSLRTLTIQLGVEACAFDSWPHVLIDPILSRALFDSKRRGLAFFLLLSQYSSLIAPSCNDSANIRENCVKQNLVHHTLHDIVYLI